MALLHAFASYPVVGSQGRNEETMLHKLKFYRAAREDAMLAKKLLIGKKCNPRHVIVLFHDTLEFLLYEYLQLLGIDIYDNGQNTIGLDRCRRC